jgi:hypothetical protein
MVDSLTFLGDIVSTRKVMGVDCGAGGALDKMVPLALGDLKIVGTEQGRTSLLVLLSPTPVGREKRRLAIPRAHTDFSEGITFEIAMASASPISRAKIPVTKKPWKVEINI